MTNDQQWIIKKLNEVAEVIMGQSPSSSTYNSERKGLPFYQGKSDFSTLYPIPRIYCSAPIKIAKNNDILISVRAPVGPINVSNSDCCIGRGLAAIRNKELYFDFLYWYFKYLEPKWSDKGKGAIFKSITKKDLDNLSVPIPSHDSDLSEQKRLSKKIATSNNLLQLTTNSVKDIDVLVNTLCAKYFINNHDNEIDLGDVCEIVKGNSPTLKTRQGNYPLVVTAEQRKTADSYQFDTEAVCVPIVSSTGHGHASLKRIHYEAGKFALANIMVALIPKNKKVILAKYLFYYLSFYKDKKLVSLMRGGANVTIPLKAMYHIKINVQSMSEQVEFIKLINKLEYLKSLLTERNKLSNLLLETTINTVFDKKTH